MVDSCCAPGCKNNRGRAKGKAYYRIPKDPERRERWISAIKQARSDQKKTERWEPAQNGFRVCSDHFISGKKSDNPRSPDYVPSIFKYVPSTEKKNKRRRKTKLDVLNRKLGEIQGEQAEKSLTPVITPPIHSCENSSTQPPAVSVKEEAPVQESSYKQEENDPETPLCSSENCKKQIKSLELECQALRGENMLLREKMNMALINETSLQNDNSKVNSLTGLSAYSLLMAIFTVIAPHLKQKSNLTVLQQYMLALIKMRMNLSFDFLAHYFCTDPSTALKLFKHTISVMYSRLVPSHVTWPDRESIRKTIPYAFRNGLFENTVCIIDCFEISLGKPSNLLTSAQCSSMQKPHHAMKYLIAFTPQGSICYISNGWGGHTSDKFITEQSDFSSHLLPGDLVLADRSFNVKDSVHSSQAGFKLQAYVRGKRQLDPLDLENITWSESLLIHIKSVIGAVRQKYSILQSAVCTGFTDVDAENDVTCLDKIVKVCCALTNVSGSSVPFQ